MLLPASTAVFRRIENPQQMSLSSDIRTQPHSVVDQHCRRPHRQTHAALRSHAKKVRTLAQPDSRYNNARPLTGSTTVVSRSRHQLTFELGRGRPGHLGAPDAGQRGRAGQRVLHRQPRRTRDDVAGVQDEAYLLRRLPVDLPSFGGCCGGCGTAGCCVGGCVKSMCQSCGRDESARCTQRQHRIKPSSTNCTYADCRTI